MRDSQLVGKGIYYYYKLNIKYEGEFADSLPNGWGCLMHN